MTSKRKLPDHFYNPLSVAGGAIAFICFATILFLTVVETVQEDAPAYIGIISYIVLPIPLLVGTVLFYVGLVRERRRLRRGLPASKLVFTLDMSVPRARTATTLLGAGGFFFLLFTMYGTYRVFEWTESTPFCGEVCHEVMEPEYAAYQYSPHARVACVDCHVGSGADWFVRSKLSGAYQVYAVMVNNFPRPIPTPIENLRPAQETCEQCHWPSHFAGEKKYINTYFATDEENTRWTLALLMKTGGGNPDKGPTGGIHYAHMNISSDIEYVATDRRRQSIPWVRVRDRQTGEVTEYISEDAELSLEELNEMPARMMDCIDCHNRPSHIYRPPTRIVDQALAIDRISTALPSIREASIEALVGEYTSTEAAMDSIPLVLQTYYEDYYPEALEDKGDLLAQAAEELKQQYRRNIFPRMDVSWKSYPNNIGHMNELGCFRCHDGRHVSPGGEVLTKDCNSCHTILYQGHDAHPSSYDLRGMDFEHPADVGDLWKEMNCNECHGGQ